jgi:uncharacterized protein YndB with AHSA1/START domain
MSDLAVPLEEDIEIAAPPAVVWSLICDLRAMRRWSPQVVRTVVIGGQTRLGARLVNLNRRGRLLWPTTARVITFEPGSTLAFRITENGAVWSFALEPTPTGTRLTERREAKDINALSLRLQDKVLGGVPAFTAELRDGMRQTLQRIKDAAETS